MAKKQARLGIISRDLVAAALLGPGPALAAAVDELAVFDNDDGQSRISPTDLHQLSARIVQSSPDSERMELLWLLARHPSITASALSAYGLPHVWELKGSMELAEMLSRERSSYLQSHLEQSLMELSPEQQQSLSHDWLTSPLSNQRAIAARLSVSQAIPQAMPILAGLSSDEDPHVRASVVEALVDMANRQPDETFKTIQSLVKEPDKHKLWVMTRVLSRAPLNRNIQLVTDLLETIAHEIRSDKDVRRWVISVIRALARQHRNRPVQDALTHWLDGNDPILAEVASEALRRIA